jgi:hypothetical protein
MFYRFATDNVNASDGWVPGGKPTINLIKDKNYFRSEGGSEGLRGLWPEAPEPSSNKDLTANALGALVAHLTRIKVRISSHTNAFLIVSLCVSPTFGLHNLPSCYLRFSLSSYHQRFMEWHNCWGRWTKSCYQMAFFSLMKYFEIHLDLMTLFSSF